jgi:hypothetical protein
MISKLSVSDSAPASSRGGTSVTEDVKAKGKAKAFSLKPTQCERSGGSYSHSYIQLTNETDLDIDDRLWVDVYEPASEVSKPEASSLNHSLATSTGRSSGPQSQSAGC